MPVNVQGFVTPEQDFRGLHKAADSLERKNYREEQLRLQREGKRAATASFLSNYLDKKDYLTGTLYDPEIARQLQDALMEGSKLASEGADPNMIMMALSPKVNKLNQYSTNAKFVNQRLKDQLAQVKPNMGYDLKALESEARKLAFLDSDGKLRDISTVDPEVDYLTETIKKYPERVTTDAGIDEFVKTSPKFTNTKDISAYNEKGGMHRKKVSITAPNYLVTDTDERGAVTGLVPKHEGALENGKPLMYEFDDGKGGKKKAQVRLFDEREFDSMMQGNPGIADWVRGQVMRANPNADLSSPQAKIAARAIMYDEMKRRMPGGIVDVEVQKENPAPRITINAGGSSKNAAADWVRRATDAAKSGDNQKIQDEFAQLLQGDKNLYESVTVEGGKLKVVYKSPQKTGILGQVIPEQPQTIEIDINDRYISQKLARVYQQIMGGDVNVERTQYNKSGKGSPTTQPVKIGELD